MRRPARRVKRGKGVHGTGGKHDVPCGGVPRRGEKGESLSLIWEERAIETPRKEEGGSLTEKAISAG